MLKLRSLPLAESLLAVCLGIAFSSSSFAQGRVPVSGAPGVSAEVQQRNSEIQKIMDRADERFQAGEEQFKKGDYQQARRAYDRAVDIILESGVDVRSDARLQQYYQKLVEQIFQRQVALLKLEPNGSSQAAETGFVSQVIQTDEPKQPVGKRGFGDQTYTASPLDELAKIKLTEDETKGATDDVVQSAVSSARLDFRFKPNALVQSYINYYMGRGRVTMESGLRRSGRYMALARRIFKEEGVPQDLAWLGQVESAWSPFARSWAAAVGLWQFIPGTGARYDLRQDYWVDERMSYEKATRASARYLKWLANRYAGNWELAMAAYNSGEGNVDRAIARSGYADFWEIYQRGLLPLETRNYVPNILATIIIAKDPEKYGFKVKPDPPLAYDTVVVNNSVDLKLVADACDVQHEYVLALNPELKRGQTPPGIPHPLRVPVKCGRQLQATLKLIPPDKRTQWRLMSAQADDTFETIARRTGVSETTLSAINGGELKPGQKVIVPLGSGGLRNVASVSPRAAAPGTTAAAGSVKIVAYTVKAGDTLTDIAARYSVSARDLAALNHLSPNTRLRAGQVIRVQTRAR
ncbi:MAG TPA: transglycosylase SLT domain-containing protein [Blastocatellia bacterium]|nr:transglycosylase SLT domain-containing protein [Blastocatellia bacterium]